LGLPPREGWTVNATAFVDFEVKGRGRSQFNRRSFQFEWLYPDAAGLGRMGVRVKQLLAQPIEHYEQAYLLGALLQVREVAGAVSVRELLAALEIQHGAFSGRSPILKHLNQSRADNAQVIADFKRRLEAGDLSAVVDLYYTPKIWSPAFVEPLLQLYERDPLRASREDVFAATRVIEIFARRNPDRPADPAVAERLSSAWLKAAPQLDKKPGELPLTSRNEWSREVEMLGKTRDMGMIHRLRPLLDDKTMVWDERYVNRLATFEIPLTRACDVAMEAILTILDGSPRKTYQKIGVHSYAFGFRDARAALNAGKQQRDKVIIALKQRLAAVQAAGRPR
jgi:hypothetical protein